jgi:hypothetical protein
MTAKQLKRKIRVLRLLATVQAYHYYTVMQMNRRLLHHDSNWQDAEHLSKWIGMLIPGQECSPADFMYDKDEICDTVIDSYDEFKKWIKLAEKVGISEKTLVAFCKNVDNMQSVFRLKVFGHILYPEWLVALLLYIQNDISKEELQNTFVKYSLFSGEAKPTNIQVFRKTVLEIEQVIAEISHKQLVRSLLKDLFKSLRL